MPSARASGSAAATILNVPTFGPTAVRTLVISSTDAPASSAAVTHRMYEDSSPPPAISAARFTSANVLESRSEPVAGHGPSLGRRDWTLTALGPAPGGSSGGAFELVDGGELI